MDLNQTTTISRRKTFTVPVPVGGVKVLEVSSNQTYTAGELGDQTINISKPSSSNALISNRPAITNSEDMSSLSSKSVLGDNGHCWEQDSLFQDEEINCLLNSLVHYRNSRYPIFEAEKGHSKGGGNEDQSDAALDRELECLRQQERHLREDVNKQASLMKLQEEKTKAEEEKNRAKIKELQNKNKRTEIKHRNEELKEEIRNTTLMTKDLVDRLNYPKAIIRNLLKVSSDHRCQDEDFCREFSGGKCLAGSNMGKK